MIKESVHREAVSIINTCHCGRVPKCKRQLLTDIKEETESSLIIVGDFSNLIAYWTEQLGRRSQGNRSCTTV